MADLFVNTGEAVRLNGSGGDIFLTNPAMTARLDLQLGGSPRLTIKDNGFVGVGVTDPSHALEIRTATEHLKLSDPGDPTQYLAVQKTSYGGSGYFYVVPAVNSNEPLTFYNPASGSQLGIRVRNNGGNYRGLTLYHNDNWGAINSENSPLALQDGGGNVGIGTTAPTAKLHVVGDTRIAAGNFAIDAGRFLYFNGLGGSRYLFDDDANNRVGISTTLFMANQAIHGAYEVRGFDDKWVLDSAGNIAIGEQKKLYLKGPGSNKHIWTSDVAGDGLEGRIAFSYNIFVKSSLGPSDPASAWIGLDKDNLLYLFFQDRAAASGGKWGGVQTFMRAPTAPMSDWGYGFQPIRVWGKNVLIDPQGVVVTRDAVVTPTIYFQNAAEIQGQPDRPSQLLHRDLTDGTFQSADYYDSNYRPWKTSPSLRELGGISWNSNQLNVSVSRSASTSELVFQDGPNPSPGIRLSQLVRANVDKVKVVSGETGGTFTIPANSRSGDPLTTINLNTSFASPTSYRVILTPRNSSSTWGVTLAVKDRTATSFTVIARNNDPSASATFYIQWLAIGT